MFLGDRSVFVGGHFFFLGFFSSGGLEKKENNKNKHENEDEDENESQSERKENLQIDFWFRISQPLNMLSFPFYNPHCTKHIQTVIDPSMNVFSFLLSLSMYSISETIKN